MWQHSFDLDINLFQGTASEIAFRILSLWKRQEILERQSFVDTIPDNMVSIFSWGDSDYSYFLPH